MLQLFGETRHTRCEPSRNGISALFLGVKQRSADISDHFSDKRLPPSQIAGVNAPAMAAENLSGKFAIIL
jgi:hypothetical protein